MNTLLATIGSLFGKRPAPEEPEHPSNGHMRDPQGDQPRYQESLRQMRQSLRTTQAELKREKPEARLRRLSMSLFNEPRYLVLLHAAGAGVAELADEAARCIADLDRSAQVIRDHGSVDVHALNGHHRFAVGFAAIALLLVPDAALVKTFHRLLSPLAADRNALLDLLVKAFDPAQPVAGQYVRNAFSKPWTDPVLRALARPQEERAAALAAHMENWTRIMRTEGWKPDLDTASGRDPLFSDFAFEVALAVCGWDIDDSAFADHPYYPRELVRHYRARLRQGRDGWRAEGVGAGIPVDAPPPPAMSDLGKSRRTGLARWIELAADGDEEAIDDAMLTIQEPYEPEDDWELLPAMQLAGLAICADCKDAEEVAVQIHALNEARGLGEFDEPAEPPAGIDRCIALLRAWDGWLAARGYRLVPVDLGNDGWNAVVVRGEYLEELRELSSDLGIPLAEPATVYSDG